MEQKYNIKTKLKGGMLIMKKGDIKISDGIKYGHVFHDLDQKVCMVCSIRFMKEHEEDLKNNNMLASDVIEKYQKSSQYNNFYDEEDTLFLTPKTVEAIDNKFMFDNEEIFKKSMDKLLKDSSLKLKDVDKKPNNGIYEQKEDGSINVIEFLPTKKKLNEVPTAKMPEQYYDYRKLLEKDKAFTGIENIRYMVDEQGKMCIVGKCPFEKKPIIFGDEFLKERYGDLAKTLDAVEAKTKENKKEEYVEAHM